MRRFITHQELARDKRFERQDNRATTILSQLPDDPEKVADVFEQLAPMIEASVKGTPLEPLFHEYGPGFGLLTRNRLRAGDPMAPLRLKQSFHGIFVGELQALEGAARSLWDFPEAPWEFKMNMARQCWDEARHVQIYEKLLEHVDGHIGEFPESTFLFETCCADDPALRVAGVNRGLEGLACDVFRNMIEYAEEIGDEKMRQAIDFVLADELTHVRFGSDWVREFTKGDPERFERAQDFRRDVDRQFNFGGSRSDDPEASIRFAFQDRLDAGFTQEELDELVELSGEGPSRKTMKRASEILHERHKARRVEQASAQ
jgi:uncharacterized ferritin-like protein (DUF455 family)